jgi:hypothetical protein
MISLISNLIIKECLFFLLTFFVMIIFHEYGHYVVLKLNKAKYVFDLNRKYWGFRYELKGKNKLEIAFWVYVIAILFGFLPIFYFSQFFSFSYITSNVLIILYLIGCIWDLKQIMRILFDDWNAMETK